MKKVVHIISTVPKGVSVPKIAELDDGTRVYLKEKNGVKGNLALVNEYFSSGIGKIVGLTMPETGICEINSNTLDDTNLISSQHYGEAFYSVEIEKANNFTPSAVNVITNKDEIYKLLVFDHLLFNADRNKGNLLIAPIKKDEMVFVIDHTHLTKMSTHWTKSNLEQLQEGDLLATDILDVGGQIYESFFRTVKLNKVKLFQEVELFKNKLSRDKMKQIMDECPKSWKPSEEDVDAFINFVGYRLDNIEKIAQMIVNYYKEKGLCI